MKKLLLSLLTLSTVLFFSCGDGAEEWTPNGPQTPPPGAGADVDYKERAKEIFDKIQVYYKTETTGLYKENYPAQAGDQAYSYLWPFDGIVSGAALLTQLGYNVNYETLVGNFDKYWRQGAAGNNIPGFGSSTNGTTGGGTRFYDDNSIAGISLVEAYHITGNAAYLAKAKQVVAFLKAGEDNKLGGALWWNEDQKDLTGVSDSNKPACSNGYATQFLLQYHEVCDASEKADVLAFAKRLYTWLRDNLLDTDNCYWNDKNNLGTVNKYKWTYNTGVMVQNGICLYRITGEKSYLDHAIASAQGAYDYFVKPRNGVSLAFPDSDPWFNTKLLRAYIDLVPLHAEADKYIRAYINFINHGYDKARTDMGFFYEDWTGADPKRYYSLLMQAAVVESYAAIAVYKEN
ncbi:glycoside hydrolase family 76 protein [Bacteroides sp. 51]|uniref:glycoside hydrolase family 76 protein n=1 Tax=Bacteroides sp. 51 TaxID=2302938 RepID=UPI0013D8C605|nr:glycoside hydrolase family 76 protein [Bacteroides sp. 51]NDV82614.1 glycosyltransferase [Bacteroides sp. 51]